MAKEAKNSIFPIYLMKAASRWTTGVNDQDTNRGDRATSAKKSILARAFRGELGTNDPAEESAAGLLQSAL